MNTETSAFAICFEANIYLLLFNLHDCTFNFSVEDHCVDIFYFCDHDYQGAMKYI